MAHQLDLKLVLEAINVKNAGQVCQQLYSAHGVSTLQQSAALSEWNIADRHLRGYVLTRARELMTSTRNFATFKQQLLVRSRMPYNMYQSKEIESVGHAFWTPTLGNGVMGAKLTTVDYR